MEGSVSSGMEESVGPFQSSTSSGLQLSSGRFETRIRSLEVESEEDDDSFYK